MTRWYGDDRIRVGGTTITVKQVKFHGSSMVVQAVGRAVQTARDWLSAVIPEIRIRNQQPYVDQVLVECFKDPPDKSVAVSTIKAVLSNVELELRKDLSIKVRDSANDHRPAAGYVRPYLDGPRERVGGAVFYDDRGREIHRRGDIHLDKSIVLMYRERAPVVLIHEAGHKFANLADFGPMGYFERDGSAYKQAGLVWQDALRNADSYAWFVQKVFHRKLRSVPGRRL